MAHPAPFLRLVMSGSLFGSESFSYSLSMIGSGSPPAEVPAGVVAAVSAFHAAPKVTTTTAQLQVIKMNMIGTNGRYVSQSDTVFHDLTPPVGGSSTASLPAQVANVVTLRTAVRRGYASTGRFYIPVPSVSIDSSGRFAQADAQAVADAATTLITSLNAAMPGWVVGVTSDVGGVARPVTQVSVGRVLDTIRSRRSSLPEDHVDGDPIDVGSGGGGGDF